MLQERSRVARKPLVHAARDDFKTIGNRGQKEGGK